MCIRRGWRACMPARVKERTWTCHEVRLPNSVTHTHTHTWRQWRLSPNHKMMIAWWVLLSVWVRRVKERACQPVFEERGEVRVELPNSTNEGFGRRNKWWNPAFRLTFKWFVAQKEYSRHWKVLRTGIHLLCILPKSSFGRDKVAKSVSLFPGLW